MKFVKKGFNDIAIEEWISFIDKYFDFIFRYYPKNRIIFIKVPIVNGFVNNANKYVEFDKSLPEIRFEPLLRKLEDYIINTKLSGAKIIEVPPNVAADGNYAYGISPLHYKSEAYLDIVYQIDEYVSQML